jgi:hypothetical protein
MLFAFDCLVLVTAGRFSELDLMVAKRALASHVPVFFVRNKVEVDFNSKRRVQKQKTDAEIREFLRGAYGSKFEEDLRGMKGEHFLYLVSAHNLEDKQCVYDEEELLTDIYQTITAQRRSA